MSEEMFHRAHMTVTSFAGPERADGGSRQRVQLYAHDGGDNRLIDLSAEQWDALRDHFAKERHPSGRARAATSTAATSTAGSGPGGSEHAGGTGG